MSQGACSGENARQLRQGTSEQTGEFEGGLSKYNGGRGLFGVHNMEQKTASIMYAACRKPKLVESNLAVTVLIILGHEVIELRQCRL